MALTQLRPPQRAGDQAEVLAPVAGMRAR